MLCMPHSLSMHIIVNLRNISLLNNNIWAASSCYNTNSSPPPPHIHDVDCVDYGLVAEGHCSNLCMCVKAGVLTGARVHVFLCLLRPVVAEKESGEEEASKHGERNETAKTEQ